VDGVGGREQEEEHELEGGEGDVGGAEDRGRGARGEDGLPQLDEEGGHGVGGFGWFFFFFLSLFRWGFSFLVCFELAFGVGDDDDTLGSVILVLRKMWYVTTLFCGRCIFLYHVSAGILRLGIFLGERLRCILQFGRIQLGPRDAQKKKKRRVYVSQKASPRNHTGTISPSLNFCWGLLSSFAPVLSARLLPGRSVSSYPVLSFWMGTGLAFRKRKRTTS
jgi:hypothetical protein